MYYSNQRGISLFWKIVVAIIIIIIVAYPVEKEGEFTRTYWEEELVHVKRLKKNIRCDRIEIKNGGKKEWSYTELGNSLRIVVEIASTEQIKMKVESSEKIEIDERAKIFTYNITVLGPSMVIEISNPLEVFGTRADLSGSVKIFHEFEKTRTVFKSEKYNGTKGVPWWWNP